MYMQQLHPTKMTKIFFTPGPPPVLIVLVDQKKTRKRFIKFSTLHICRSFILPKQPRILFMWLHFTTQYQYGRQMKLDSMQYVVEEMESLKKNLFLGIINIGGLETNKYINSDHGFVDFVRDLEVFSRQLSIFLALHY